MKLLYGIKESCDLTALLKQVSCGYEFLFSSLLFTCYMHTACASLPSYTTYTNLYKTPEFRKMLRLKFNKRNAFNKLSPRSKEGNINIYFNKWSKSNK